MRVFPSKRSAVLCFVLFLMPAFLQAHPHMFIDNKVTVVFDEEGLAGFRLDWAFDRVFSASMIHDFDLNGDGIFSTAEIATIEDLAFSNLSNFDYFCQITIDDAVFQVQYVTDFRAIIREKIVIYNFSVPCHVRGTANFKTVTVAVYDETYFVDIVFAEEEAVGVENGNFFEHSYTLSENEKKAYWGEQIIPTEIYLQFRKKS